MANITWICNELNILYSFFIFFKSIDDFDNTLISEEVYIYIHCEHEYFSISLK